MATVDPVPNELEKLLADVQRTIRENEQFIRFLKEETVDSDSAVGTETVDNNENIDEDEYEEL
jgi:CRISPR/Cas system-associated endoribonuclease Cas2